MNCSDIVEQTNELFDKELKLSMPTAVDEYIADCKKLGLNSQIQSEIHYNSKIENTKQSGFIQLSETDIIKIINPAADKIKYYDAPYAGSLQTDFYDPYLKKYWYCRYYSKVYGPGLWTTKYWEIQRYSFQDINRPIPHWIIKRIIKLKDLNYFNLFMAFCPRKNLDGAPTIFVATLCNGHHFDNGYAVTYLNEAKITLNHFFIAKW